MLFAQEGTALEFTGGAAATSTLITFLLGIGIVFIGLVALIVIIKIMGALMRNSRKAKPEPTAEPAQAQAAESVGDRGEIIAAVSAAIATVMGESVNGIRIVSFKKVD